jgi:hypothetical protein
LLLLARARDASRDYVAFEDSRRDPPVYVGPYGAQDVAEAIDRALRRKRMLDQVKELLSLHDRCADLHNPELSDLSNDELKKLADARKIGSLSRPVDDVDHPTLRDTLPGRSSDSEHDKWLQETLAHLSVCREVRETIGWQEITELIDPSWLKRKGFGPSTPVDIGALRGKLISETPRTSGPSSSTVPSAIDGLVEIGAPDGDFRLQGAPTSSDRSRPPPAAESEAIPVAPAPSTKSVVGSGKKRGQKSVKRDRVKEAMRAELANGLTPIELYEMPEKQWDKYPAKRTACRQARNEILAECAKNAARHRDKKTLDSLAKIAAAAPKLFELSTALAEISASKSRQIATKDK